MKREATNKRLILLEGQQILLEQLIEEGAQSCMLKMTPKTKQETT
jgi:hypothetical protein